MYYRSAVQNLPAVTAVFRSYLYTPLEDEQLLLRLHIPLALERNADRKYAKAAQLIARNMVGVEAHHLFTPYVRFLQSGVYMLHGSGSMSGAEDLKLLLPLLYSKITQMQALSLHNLAAIQLGDFELRLYSVYSLGLEKIEAFSLLPECLTSIYAAPRDLICLIIRISSENVKSQALLRQFSEMIVGQLFCQFRHISFDKMIRIMQMAAYNGQLTYKQAPISTFDDLRLQCNNYIENYKDASKIFLGSQFTRHYNAPSCDHDGVANAFSNGGIYVDFEWEMCQLCELFQLPAANTAMGAPGLR